MDTERVYRAALLAYPTAYRRSRAEEMLGVLMESAPGRASFAESLGLVRHGLVMRVLGPGRRRVWRPSSSAAAMAIATALAALAVTVLAQTGQFLWEARGDNPGMVVAVDPRWPVYVLWLVTFGLLLARPGLLSALSAWIAAVAYVLLTAARVVDPGHGGLEGLGETWAAYELAVPSALLALLLTNPAVGRGARASVGGRALLVASLAGVAPAFASGVSSAWPVELVLLVFLGAFIGRGVFLRGTLLLALAFVYVPLSGLTDGSGSRLPQAPAALAVTLVALPLLGAAVAAVAVHVLDGNRWVTDRVVAVLDRVTDAVRGSSPTL